MLLKNGGRNLPKPPKFGCWIILLFTSHKSGEYNGLRFMDGSGTVRDRKNELEETT